MLKIAVTTTSFGKCDKKPLEMLKSGKYEVLFNPCGRLLKKDEVIVFCKDAAGIIAGTEQLDADVMDNLPNLRIISRCGTGLDNIDLKAAERLGIKVFNTPDAPTRAVAELTIGLILNLLRKVNQQDTAIRNGKWEKLMGNLLYGKKVGIIGFGRIGKKVAGLLMPFDCEIAYMDPLMEDGLLGLKRLTIEELLCWADIISIHVSAKEKLIGEKEFRLIKKEAWLINTSRGGVVDEFILYEYLKNGYLSGAALDVFEQEPYNGPFRELENIILTTHIGSYAKEARVDMEMEAVNNLLKGFRNSEC